MSLLVPGTAEKKKEKILLAYTSYEYPVSNNKKYLYVTWKLFFTFTQKAVMLGVRVLLVMCQQKLCVKIRKGFLASLICCPIIKSQPVIALVLNARL